MLFSRRHDQGHLAEVESALVDLRFQTRDRELVSALLTPASARTKGDKKIIKAANDLIKIHNATCDAAAVHGHGWCFSESGVFGDCWFKPNGRLPQKKSLYR